MVKDQNKFKNISNKLRLKILKIINDTRASHIGSIFSCLDIILYIYIKIIKFKNKSPNHDFILSKGHAGLGLYTCLSYLKIISERKLNTYYKNGSKLSGHVSHHGVEGVEISTGSLGHGLSIGCGLAYGNKLNITQIYVLPCHLLVHIKLRFITNIRTVQKQISLPNAIMTL